MVKIIGLVGTHASGKDTVAHYLVERHGFFHVSTGDIVREEAMKKYGSIERPVLYKTANELRQKNGHGVLSLIALERFKKVKNQYKGLIVSGFRAVAEAQVIKQYGGIVIFIDAPIKIRFNRLKERARVEEGSLSYAEFKKREAIENGGIETAFDIRAMKADADFVLNNDNNRVELLSAIDQALGL